MNKSIIHRAMITVGAVLLAGCGSSDEGAPASESDGARRSEKLAVFTTFYPTQYFTQRIGGDLVDVTCPVPEDEDAIFWMPGEAAIRGFQSAELIILNGAGFAKWVDKVNLPESRMVNTALPLQPGLMKYEDAVEHSHGKTGSHSHEGIDGHTWVDPINAKAQAGGILNALILRLPAAQATLEANHQSLAADLDALDVRLKELASAGMPPLLCSHPAYNYIARRYGWNIHILDLDPAEMPADAIMAEIAETLKTHPAKWILWEDDPLPEIAARFENELGVRSITFSPCELLSAEEKENGADYLSVMIGNLDRLSAAAR